MAGVEPVRQGAWPPGRRREARGGDPPAGPEAHDVPPDRRQARPRRGAAVAGAPGCSGHLRRRARLPHRARGGGELPLRAFRGLQGRAGRAAAVARRRCHASRLRGHERGPEGAGRGRHDPRRGAVAHCGEAGRRGLGGGRARPLCRRVRQPRLGLSLAGQRLRRALSLRARARLVCEPVRGARRDRAPSGRAGRRPRRLGHTQGAAAAAQVEPRALRVAGLAHRLCRQRPCAPS